MSATEIILAILALLSAPVGGWLTAVFMRDKYNAEVAKLQTDVQAAQTNTRSQELENVKKAMDILLEQIVEPLKKEINAIRREMQRLRKAVEKANVCPHATDCPVRSELQNTDYNEPEPSGRQPAHRKKGSHDPRACADEPGGNAYTDQRTYTVAPGHGL